MTRSRMLLASVALALATTACAGSTATETAAVVGEPTSLPPAAGACLAGAEDCQDTGPDGGLAPGEPEPSGEQVEPVEGLEDIRPVGWERVEVDPADQTRVTVHWTSGVAPCNALSEITAEFTDEALTLTVLEGTVPADEPQACIEIAQLKQSTITLDEEVGPRSILDGAES